MSNQSQSPLHVAAKMASENPPILAGFEWEFLVALSAQDHHPTDRRWFARPPPPRAVTPTPVPVPIIGGQRRGARRGRAQPQTLTMIPPHPQPLAVDSRRRGPPQIHKKIEEVLRSRAGVAVFSRNEIENPPLARDALLGYGIIPKDFVHTEFQAYSVGADNSLHAGDEDSQAWVDKRYQWTGVEVKSRVFTQGEMTPIAPPNLTLPEDNDKRTREGHGDNSLCARELHNVCTALRSNLRIQINQTCAFQVTVSHQTEGGLDLMSLKKIVTLAWILEKPLLFALCAPHRRPGSNNEYCLPITEHSDLAHGAAPVKDEFDFGGVGGNHFYWDGLFEKYVVGGIEAFRQDVGSSQSQDDGDGDNTWQEITLNREIETLKHHLLTLWRVKTIGDLKSLLNRYMLNPGRAISSHRLSLAVKFLGFSAPPTNTAVEFRMHEGTFDPVLGKMWGDVCVALVKVATQTKTIQAPAGNSGDGGDGNGNGEGSSVFVDTEARAFSEMLRSMLHKTTGTKDNANNISRASVLLRELGISPRQISLWGSKISHMESITATHMSMNQEDEEGQSEGKGNEVIKQEETLPTIATYPDLDEAGPSGAGFASFAPVIASQYVDQPPRPGSLNAPSSSSLQADLFSEGCTCSTRYTYSSASFLPEVQVCTCTGGSINTQTGTGPDRGHGYGGGRENGGSEQGHVSNSSQSDSHPQESHPSTSYQAGPSNPDPQDASWIDPAFLPQAALSNSRQEAQPSAPDPIEVEGSCIDPALLPQELAQPDSYQNIQPTDENPVNGSWVNPAALLPHQPLHPGPAAAADTNPVDVDDLPLDPMLNESFDMIDPSILLGPQD